MPKIVPIAALKDNYIWAICDTAMRHVAVVDPGDATPVLDFLQANNMSLTHILLTHHHQDHTGGVADLLAYKEVPVWRTANTTDGMPILLMAQQVELNVLAIPGHTLDHIAFYNDQYLFCGDTLFSGGCGRVFEGTATQMLNSLQKLKTLPHHTQVYCGHEYTVHNLQFAAFVEPNNLDLQKRLQQAQELERQGLPTLPATIKDELSYNPFLRTDHITVIDAVQEHCKKILHSEVEVFAELRQWKNTFQ